MRVVIQRVTGASVEIEGKLHSAIRKGMLVLVGIEHDDSSEDARWLAGKLSSLRIFDDSQAVMNLDIRQAEGEFLVVSQFTLHASTKKGNRPSYIRSAGREHALPLYREFIDQLAEASKVRVSEGVFGADMKISLVNDGPVTIIIDSRQKE